MSLRWPLAALLLLAVPVVLAVYWWSMRRRRKRAIRWSSLSLLRSVVATQPSWKRHLPVGLLLGAMAVLALASARPQISRDVPIDRTSIILALDVSQSMCATDVEPNRLSVAQAAALEFVEAQKDGARLGLVVFAGSAQLVVPPTSDRDMLRDAIEALTTSRGTAIGAAILQGIDAIATINPQVEPVGDAAAGAGTEDGGGSGRDGGTPTTTTTTTTAAPAPGGRSGGDAAAYAADVIVLLTDGSNTRGITPIDAAEIAAARGVRVFTIGFGTSEPSGLSCTRAQLGAAALGGDAAFGGGGFGGGGFGGGGRGGRGSPLVADAATLEAVADRTGGAHYAAEDAAQLRGVFADLPRDIATQQQDEEITGVLAALGAILAAAAVLASMRFGARP